jgi:peptide/nickel transport system permease protein
MGRYLIERLGFALLLIVVVSSLALALTRLAPGDYATVQGVTLTAEQRAALRAANGLDESFASQYVEWLAGAARLDFGESLLYLRPVRSIVGERALNTAVLAVMALLLATIIGVPLGIYSGTRSGAGRTIVRTFSLVGLSVPPLIGSLALVFLAARTGWLPVGGMTSSGGVDLTWGAWFVDLIKHIPLPALALAIPMAATLERLQSEAIAGAMHERFVDASRARGVDEGRAILHHAWPVSLRPVLAFYGVMIGSLFSGSFVVEVVTSWPGLGRLMFEALKARDIFLVAGCAATGAFFLAVGTLLADVLLAFTDPRVGSGERA